MSKISNQKGFSLIIAIVILILFGILAAMLTSLVTTDSDIGMYQARSGEALYIANAGQQHLMKQSYPNYSKPPYSGRGTSKVNLGSGGFIVDPPTVITNNPLTAAATTINVVSTTGFPAPGRILIESELIDYTGTTAASFTGATRGVGGSLAVQHNIDSGVYHATALSASVTNVSTTIPVSSTTGFMIPGTIKIDQEFLYCTGIVGGFLGCTRGTQGSQAVAHNSGATAIQITTAVTATVPTGIIGDAKRVLRAQAGKYLDGWGVGGAVPITANLNSVFCNSAIDCWAVGAGGAIIHYDGVSWSSVSSPTTLDLNEVHCVSTTDCWAVGQRSGPTRTGWTFLRWNNPIPNTWNQVTVDTGAGSTAQDLNSLSMVSATDGWAVGDHIANTTTGWTFLRWNNPVANTWNLVTPPPTPRNAQRLNSVYMVSPTVGWAVGDRRGCISPGPTILIWDGTSWACQGSLPGSADENLSSVFMISSTDGWVVGDPGGGGQRPLILRCTGGSPCTWSLQDTSTLNINQPLNSVFCTGQTDCRAVGDPGAGASQRPLIVRWTTCPAPTICDWTTQNSSLNINETLNSINCPGANPNDCWTVGTNGTILHWDGFAWAAPPSPPPALLRWNGINWDNVSVPVGLTQSLNSISMLDIDLNGFSEDGWTVGDRIANATNSWTFLRWNSPTAGTWNQITVTTAANAQNLNSVSMVSATDGWTVGNRIANATNGWTFLRWDGSIWNQITVTTAANAQNLNSVYMVSGSDGWTVGNRIANATNGWTFLRWNSPTAGTWNQITVTTAANAQNLNSVSMVSATDGWTVGNRIGAGNNEWTFLRWTGSWSQFIITTGIGAQNLNSIFMVSASDGWAVGNRRGCANPGLTILRWNGASWACPGGLPVIDQNLNSVYCNSSTDCWASGNTGIILHRDGTIWSQYFSPTANSLNEVFMVRPQNFLRLADWQEVY